MASMILECPHCGAEKIGFSILFEKTASVQPSVVHRVRTFAICSGCEEAVIVVFDHPNSISFKNGGASPANCALDPAKFDWRIVAIYPQPQPSKCPAFTPDELKRLFLQAANALRRGDPDASGAMSRKVVDVSTQRLLGDESKNFHNIRGRIDALAARAILTPDLTKWAHEVRLGGNDAAHDIDPYTKEEADELLDFAELYLTYVYTLPNRLKERRERSEKEKSAAK